MIAPVEFSTFGADPGDRFELWRTQFHAVHAVEVGSERRAEFAARGRNWRLGPILFGVFETPARRVIRTSQQRHEDDLDQIVLRVPRRGEIRSSSDRGTFVAGPGEIAIGSYAATYEEEHSDGEWVTAILDRDAFPVFMGGVPVPRVLNGTASHILAEFLLSLPVRLEGLPPDEERQIEGIVHAMISACLAGHFANGEMSLRDREVLLRERVESIIAAHIASPRLTPVRIADLAGVSRSTLYRAYEADGGIAARILRRRLDLVRRDLATPGLARVPIGKVAERRGLHNAASFHRAFRRHFGQTPGDMRQASSAAPAPAAGPAARQDELRFIELLRAGQR